MVTGGAGFIGSHLIQSLLKQKYHVICVDNFSDAYKTEFKYQNIAVMRRSASFYLKEIDICNLSDLQKVFVSENIHSVIHLAARTGVRDSLAEPLSYEQVNIGGTYNVLYLAHIHKVKQVIFASSSSVYGNGKIPFVEDQAAMSPLSPYAASKRSAELACYAFHRSYGLAITILRLFSVYGPAGRPDMAPYRFTEAILHNKEILQFGDGSMARDWTYVDDIVDGILKSLNSPLPFSIFNLGSGKPITTTQLIKHIQSICGYKSRIKKLPRHSEESLVTCANHSKAQRVLGWRVKIAIEVGLTKFIHWYQNHRLKNEKI